MTSRDAAAESLARRIEQALTGQARFFAELVSLTDEGQYRDLLRAWGLVRQRRHLERDEEGRYTLGPAGPAGEAPR